MKKLISSMNEVATQLIPLLNIHMMGNERELAIIEECKQKHPEFYTPEYLAEQRRLLEKIPCNIAGLRDTHITN